MDIEGADQLARLAKALKEAGRKDLQKELSKSINRAVRPLKEDIRQSAGTLPRRGGLADEVAASKITTRRQNSKKATGIRLVAKSRYSLWHINQGQIRHRVKGKSPDQWPVQRTAPGFWSKPTEEAAPEVRREILQAMDAIAHKIEEAP